MSQEQSAPIWDRSKSPRKNEHLQHWLKFNRLLADTNDTILTESMNEIVVTFGGWKSLFMLISKFAEQSQIESMYKIIKQMKLNHQATECTQTVQHNGLKDEDIDIIDVDDQESTNNINPFLLLPNETLSHVCGYLSQAEVKQFKETSRHIGIICLEEQTKTGIAALNANEFIISDDMNLYDFKYGCNAFKQSRHNSNKRFYSFFEEWREKYGIPENNQLIATFPQFAYGRFTSCHINNLQPLRLKPINTVKCRRFLVCDNRKIVILDTKNVRRFNIEIDSVKKLFEYKLMILEYFDVLKQQRNVVQFLLYHQDISYLNILEYIEHKYIYINTIDNTWHKELKLILKQMNYDGNCPKLCVYKYSSSYSHSLKLVLDTEVEQTQLLCCGYTVQLNSNHQWFNKTNKIDDIKQICAEKMDAFHLTVEEFCRNVLNAEVNYKGNQETLKRAVQKYYESRFENEQEREVFDEDLKTTLKFIDGFNGYVFKIKTFKTSLSGSIRIKLAHEFKNIVKPNNIELFDYDYNNRKAWKDTLGHSIKFDIVLYDTEEYVSNDDVIYRIRINNLNDAPYPFINSDTANDYITFKYRKDFKIKSFVNAMFCSIYKAKGHLLRYQFDDLLKIYFKDKNGKKRNDNITCIIADRIDAGYYYGGTKSIDAYTFHNKYQLNKSDWYYVSVVKLDLFMIETNRDDQSKVKLKIKFVSRSNEKFSAKIDINKLKHIKWVGMPMILWINKLDTLQDIIDNYLSDDVKQHVQYTYRVITDTKIVSIARGKRKTYEPYYELLRRNENDYIVILLTKTRENLLCVFPKSVHKQLHS